jgi:hypothetical protein
MFVSAMPSLRPDRALITPCLIAGTLHRGMRAVLPQSAASAAETATQKLGPKSLDALGRRFGYAHEELAPRAFGSSLSPRVSA